MTPFDYYRDQCKKGFIIEDHNQLQALHHLQRVYIDLVDEHKKRCGIFSTLRKPQLVHGAYLWGGVGIGKTFLLDCLYRSLPFNNKLRMHFHAFMQLVHRELKSHQGKKDPLKHIAKDLAKKYLLLCFDEFVVSDIADAMLLGRLFRLMFAYGVCLVTTSNAMPDDLYKRGLQRKSFLPTIALLKQHTDVIHLPTSLDYRARYLKTTGVFYSPNDEASRNSMEKSFAILSNNEEFSLKPIEIHGRKIQIIKEADDVIWFEFDKICGVPRSQQDYLAIAAQYKTVFISNVAPISSHATDRINLFIRMIDIFYDYHTKVIISSAVDVVDIYREGNMLSDYKRTHSRLLEMQSDAYLARTEVREL